MVYKTVFVQVIAFFRRYVQDTGRLDLPVFVRCDKLGILAQMPHAVCGDLLSQSNRNHLLGGCDKTPRFVHNIKDCFDSLFHYGKPPFVHHFVKYPVLLLQGVVTRLHHLKQILKIPVIFQGFSYLACVFFI